MIQMTVNKDCIRINGHAGYAPIGQDIVCSAVSVLTYTFVESLKDISHDEFHYEEGIGTFWIDVSNLSEQGKLLLSSFELGMKAVAESYPKYCSIEYIARA